MYIKCRGFCFGCNAPLRPYIKSNNQEVRDLIRKYRRINPIWLYNNDTYYKFYGLKLNRVCYSCFTIIKKPSLKELRNIETGKCKPLPKTSLSLTRNYLLLWYNSLHKYVSNNFRNRQMIVYNDI